MPQAVAAVVAWVAGALGVSTATAAFIVRLAATVLLSVISSKLFGPKIPGGVGFSGLQVTTRSALEYRKIIYGTAMVSGPVVYNNLSGNDNSDLWTQIAMCHGQSEDLVSVWLDGDEIPKADIDWTAGTGGSDGSGTAEVSTSKFVGENATKAAMVYYYLGDDDQPVSTALSAFSDIGSNHRLRGVTHIIFRLVYNEDTAKVWETGSPQTYRAVIKGRLIYDPRLDSTNGGSGSHRYDDTSTWEFSDNPALCVSDYLISFMGVDPATSINWTSVAEAADDCDVSVDIPVSSTEKRFTCNGALTLGETHKDNLDFILSSMAGRLSYSAGQWTVRAAVWESASVTFDEDDLAGNIEVRGSAPKGERFNKVRGYYSDPERQFEYVEFEPVTNAAYVTRDDGRVIERELELPMTNSEYMAQRIAFRLLEQGNEQKVVTTPVNARGAKAAIGDVIALDIDELSWSGETFRLVNWGRNNDGSFQLTLREDSSTAYDDPEEGDYTTKGSQLVTTPPSNVPAPTGLSTSNIFDGVQLTWTNPAPRLFAEIEVWASNDNDRSNAVLIGTTSGETFIEKIITNHRNRYYWIRAKRANGQVSDWEPSGSTSGVVGRPLLPSNNLLSDPDFALSTALGSYDVTTPSSVDLDNPWVQWTEDSSGTPTTPSSITFQSGGGTNGGNAIKLVKGDPPNSPTTSEGAFKCTKRFRQNQEKYKVAIRWRNQGASAFNDVIIRVRGWDSEVAGTVWGVTNLSSVSFATTSSTWQTTTFDLATGTNHEKAEFWEFEFFWSDSTSPSGELEIDSVFVFANP